MDMPKNCFDCHGDGPDCVFYRCNVCEVNVCWNCIAGHHPTDECPCPACDVLIPEGELCNIKLICPSCSATINYPRCQTCPHPHLLVEEVFECFKCKREGCGENIRLCGFDVSCDKHICLDCGFRCDDRCDLVRCCFEHAEKCRECGCTGLVRCSQCQGDDYFCKRGPICIDCINGFHPGKCRSDGDEYDYEWIDETENLATSVAPVGHWIITKKEPKEEEKEAEGNADPDLENLEAAEKERIACLVCVPISEHKEKQEAEGKKLSTRLPPVGKKEGGPPETQSANQEAEEKGFWGHADYFEFVYEACDD